MADQIIVYNIDAAQFQKPLTMLAETMAQKLQREVPSLISAPPFVSIDMFVMMRQAMHTFNLLCFINADERRETDTSWNPAYTFVTAPLVRSMIDILYNITYILLDPAPHGRDFRLAGFKKEISDLEDDEKRYGGQPTWEVYFKKKRELLDLGMRSSGVTSSDVSAAKPWTTLGKYVSDKGVGGTLSAHQAFLKTFTHGIWREYSAMSHGGFEGLMDTAVYFTRDAQLHEFRPKLDEVFPKIMSLHMMRASLALLCIVTEIQLKFRFLDANINKRLTDIWQVLMPAFEAKELYDEHYGPLMKQNGIKA
jgi:hypothetical protein